MEAHFREDPIMSKSSNESELRPGSFLALLCLGVSAVCLNGCGAEYASPDLVLAADYRERHPIVLAQAPTTLDVFPIAGRIDSQSAANIRSFVARYRSFGSGPIVILTPAGRRDGSAEAVNEIRRMLYSSGLRGNVTVGSYPVADPSLASPVLLEFRGLKAVVTSPCGQWPRDLNSADSIQGWQNEPYWNFGCATQAVMAAQVDDPRDFVRARASTPPDEDMRLRAITNVRNGQDPGTNWKTTTTTIGQVGGG